MQILSNDSEKRLIIKEARDWRLEARFSIKNKED